MAYVLIKFANSPRPDLWVLERSTDFGLTYEPWQYFACEYGCELKLSWGKSLCCSGQENCFALWGYMYLLKHCHQCPPKSLWMPKLAAMSVVGHYWSLLFAIPSLSALYHIQTAVFQLLHKQTSSSQAGGRCNMRSGGTKQSLSHHQRRGTAQAGRELLFCCCARWEERLPKPSLYVRNSLFPIL